LVSSVPKSVTGPMGNVERCRTRFIACNSYLSQLPTR
jgi:hypothetical protein